jgi:hypothetical protein
MSDLAAVLHPRRANPMTGSPNPKSSKETETLNEPATKSWSSDLIQRTTKLTIEAVDNRFIQAEGRLAEVEKEVVEVKTREETTSREARRIVDLVAMHDSELKAMQALLDELRKKLDGVDDLRDAMTQHNGKGKGKGGMLGDPDCISIPFERRVIATMGNLGWDTSATVLEARAMEVFEGCGVSKTLFSSVTANRNPGSVCTVVFQQAADLQAAKWKVKQLRKTWPDCRNEVWLDASKTREELLPSRVINRAFKAMNEHGSEMEPPVVYSLDFKAKRVKLGAVCFAFTNGGKLQFTAVAVASLAEEVRSMVVGFAQE